MIAGRLEEFSRERLGGRPVPEDVRILATAQWEGREHPFERFGITILEPGVTNPMTDHSYLSEKERAKPDIMANGVAFERMAEYLKVIAQHEDGEGYGYWVHPEQRKDQSPPVIKLDTEGTFWVLAGRTFSEACLDDISYDDDELFVEVAAELAQLHISIPGSSGKDLGELSVSPSPEDVHHRFYNAERERLGLPALPG